jgi:hypothetical protein
MLAVIQNQSPETVVVGLGTLALINAGLAQSKNRSGLNWFLLSLLLGPIATFCIVIMDPLPKKI